MKDYNKLTWWSEERKTFYAEVNESKEKKQGDEGEEIVKTYLRNQGWKIRESTAEEDANKHADFYVWYNNRWCSVDVKHQKVVTLELLNKWGKTGTTLLPDGVGADIVIHLLKDKNLMYFYERHMVRAWWYASRGLHSYAKQVGNQRLFFLFDRTMNRLNFIQKVELK